MAGDSDLTHNLQHGVDIVKDTLSDAAESAQDTAAGAAQTAKSALVGATDALKSSVSGATDAVKSSVSGATDAVKSSVSGATDAVKNTVGGAADAAKSTFGGATGTVMSKARTTLSGVNDLGGLARGLYKSARSIAEDNPIGLALGAVAVGFLAGLLLPVSDLERERVGPLGEAVVERARDAAVDLAEQGKAAVAQAVSDTLSAASRPGLSNHEEHA